ncbi:MAG TPA: hypothetical protein VKZ18_19965 [Polyangia bacterium]|nr:hypothetical protein [Polyangia bacterium]
MQLRVVRSAVVLFVIALFALPARAERKHDKDQKLVEQGRRAYNLGHWADALSDFEKAYELSGDAALLFNLAETHRQLGHSADALRLYNSYLRELPTGSDHDAAVSAVKDLSAATGAKPAAPAAPRPTTPPPAPAATAPKPAPASNPPPAASAKPPAASPAPATSPPPAKSTTWPPPATTPPPAASAPPASASPPPPAAGPVVTPVAPAPTGSTLPPAAAPSASGPPMLVAQPAPPARHRPKWPVIAGAAATGAFAAGAIAFRLSGDSLYNDLRVSCGNTAAGCAPGQIDSVKTRDHAATALWILSGAAAVATSVFLIVRF